MKYSTLLFFFLAFAVGFILFKVKYEVVEIEQKLDRTIAQIEREKENIHVLKAEWSHLNEPQRLQKLAAKHLDIRPMRTEQIAAVRSDLREKGMLTDGLPRSHLTSMKEVQ
jgi:cell division protein FtsL